MSATNPDLALEGAGHTLTLWVAMSHRLNDRWEIRVEYKETGELFAWVEGATCDESNDRAALVVKVVNERAQLVAEVQACRQTMASLERGQDELVAERDALRAGLKEIYTQFPAPQHPLEVEALNQARALLNLSAPVG